VHKWKPEDEIAVLGEIAAGFAAYPEGKLPEGLELCATYMTGTQGAFCVWKAPNGAVLERLFDQHLPTLKKGTEFVPVIQSFPPTIEWVVSLYQAYVKGASK